MLPTSPGQFGDPFFLRMMAALGPRLAQAGLDLLVTAARPGAEELAAYRHLVDARRVDGMVVCRTHRRDERIALLQERELPFVAHGRTETDRPYAHVDIDGKSAFAAATRRLIELGHRRIALVNASETYMFAVHREAGWRVAMREYGLATELRHHGEPTEENGFRLAAALLGAAAPPTALLCATDRLAVGAIHAATAAGLRVGRDVAVIGYDDQPLASYTDPPLTTFHQPIEHAAVRMADMLVALLGGAAPDGMAEIWPATLVIRASDGPATTNTANNRGPGKLQGEIHVPEGHRP